VAVVAGTGARRTVIGRRLVLVALGVTAVLAAGSVLSGAWAKVTFEPTEAANFQGWAATPMVTAGLAALGCSGVGLAGWFAVRRPPWAVVAPAAAVAGAAVILAWGSAARTARSHPETARARALATLAMPGGYIPAAVTVVHLSAVSAPAAIRTWTAPTAAPACADLRDRLAGWADPGSVRGPPATVVGRCSWSARWHGHAVDADVAADRQGTPTVSVRLAG